jgi:NDP-4-keto-2,6-dideoxyhexose 3-C-methyltransferase
MIKKITKCRICQESELTPLMLLENQALTGVFPKSKTEKVTSGSVELVKCTSVRGCGLVQLRQSYDLTEMYGFNYGYRSSLNPSMVRHLRSKVASILATNVLQKGDIIIDIGSNDATTLRAYPSNEYELVGIDPTGSKFLDFYPKEICLITEFFSGKTVSKTLRGKKARVITSFSMFYDLEDPITFAKEVEDTLALDGLWIFEQSYLPAMLRTNSFDTICHEHLEFYTLKQIMWIAEKARLKVLDVEFNDINGGSFSITCSKIDAKHEPKRDKINEILIDETKLGLDTTEAFDAFKVRVEKARDDLMSFLIKAKYEGRRVCGLGASTKGNVLLQYFGIGEDLISMIGEVNSDKFGSFTPGTLIPLEAEDKVLASNPDYLLILPWHFRQFFESLPSLKGRKLVFPLPNFEIVCL